MGLQPACHGRHADLVSLRSRPRWWARIGMQFRASSEVGSALGGPKLIFRYVAALWVGGFNQRNQTGPSSGRIRTRSRLFGLPPSEHVLEFDGVVVPRSCPIEGFQAGQRADDRVDKAIGFDEGSVSNSRLQSVSNARAGRSGWVRVPSEDTSARCEHVSRTLLPVQLGDTELA
jgi:hypothetical protein